MTKNLSSPYPPPDARVLIAPVMMIDAADSVITSTVASIRSRVISARGRKSAKTSAFHTQLHFSAAGIGKSADIVVMPQ